MVTNRPLLAASTPGGASSTGDGRVAVCGQSFADLVVHLLQLDEEVVAAGGKDVARRPHGEVATRAEQGGELRVADGGVDPMPRGRRDRGVEAGSVGWLPGLEVGVNDVHVCIASEACPRHGDERFTEFNTGHHQPAINQRPGRDTGPRADLQHVIAGM